MKSLTFVLIVLKFSDGKKEEEKEEHENPFINSSIIAVHYLCESKISIFVVWSGQSKQKTFQLMTTT